MIVLIQLFYNLTKGVNIFGSTKPNWDSFYRIPNWYSWKLVKVIENMKIWKNCHSLEKLRWQWYNGMSCPRCDFGTEKNIDIKRKTNETPIICSSVLKSPSNIQKLLKAAVSCIAPMGWEVHISSETYFFFLFDAAEHVSHIIHCLKIWKCKKFCWDIFPMAWLQCCSSLFSSHSYL